MFSLLANLEGPLPWLVVGMALLLIFGGRLPQLARELKGSLDDFERESGKERFLQPPRTRAELADSAAKNSSELFFLALIAVAVALLVLIASSSY